MRCSVEFVNNPYKTYFAGNTLYGCVNIALERERYIKCKDIMFFSIVNLLLYPSTALMIHIKGRAKVRFNKGRSSVAGKQTFIDEYLLVVSNIRLPVGQHTFQFESELPTNCPPSFKGKHGHIKYEAVIVIPRMLWDKRIPFEFHILSYSPLPFFDANVSLCELERVLIISFPDSSENQYMLNTHSLLSKERIPSRRIHFDRYRHR